MRSPSPTSPLGHRAWPGAALVLSLLAAGACNNFKKGTIYNGGAGQGGAGPGGAGGHRDASAEDAVGGRRDASAEDAVGGRRDASAETGTHDGGTHDGGAHDGGAHDAVQDRPTHDASPRDATPDVPVGIPTNQLLAYYPFNGNTNDESGNGQTAMANLGMFDTDRFGEANKAYNLTFNNSNDWYGIVAAPPLAVISSFTIAIWVRVAPNGNNERIAGVGNWVGLQFSGQNATFGLPGMAVVTDPTAITKNQWTLLVGVVSANVNGDLISLYRDGNMVASQMFTDFYLAGSPNNCRFYMGNTLLGGTSQNCTGTSQANEFPGDVDDIRVYGRALTGAEIQALYHQTP